MSKITTGKYRVPFLLATTLFFLWGFARNILSVLNKHFQDVFDIGIAKSSWVEVCTFLGYFLMAMPAGMYVAKHGYQRTMVLGLIVFAAGCLLFVPCASAGQFSWLLIAFFIIACGLVFLEVSANPYVTKLGPAETASSRLNMAQSLNGLGGIMAPLIMGGFLFSDEELPVGESLLFRASIPYIVMGLVVLLIAVVFANVNLPQSAISTSVAADEESCDNRHRLRESAPFVFALIALLAYEVAEISVNSYFINYSVGQLGVEAAGASRWLSVCLGVFMIGRFVGSIIMARVSAVKVLAVCGVGAVLSVATLMLLAMFSPDSTSLQMLTLLLLYLCESIMFPTIYSQALLRLPQNLLPRAGAILMMTPVGGCAFLLMGAMADSMGYVIPFAMPLAGYIIVASYAIWRNNNQNEIKK